MKRRGWAWVALALAIAVHVADEAAHDFLALYNPTVEAIRRAAPFLPLPVFTFPVWIGGLAAAVALMLAVSPAVFRGARWARPVCYILSVLMMFNGVGGALGAWFAGFAYDHTQTYFYVFMLMIGSYLFSCVNVWWAAPRVIQKDMRVGLT